MRRFAIVGLLMVLAGCGSSHRDPNAIYLTLVRQPLAGELASSPPNRLIALGHRACGDLAAGFTPDRVVADLGGDPEPGSGAFNAYSFIAAAAADELCPAHKNAFSGSLSDLSG